MKQESVQRIVGRVGEARGEGLGLDQLQRPRGLGMGRQEGSATPPGPACRSSDRAQPQRAARRRPAHPSAETPGCRSCRCASCSPLASWNSSARLRTAAGPSGIIGRPPARAKRPITGMRPGANTEAVDSRAPLPLLSNQPVRQTPLAWLRRKPGCSPFTASKRAIICLRSRRPGDSQPAVAANAPAMREHHDTDAGKTHQRRRFHEIGEAVAIDRHPGPLLLWPNSP